MKKLSIIFISLLFLFAACGENKETSDAVIADEKNKYAFDTTEIKTVPINETGSVNLKYRFTGKDEFIYRLTTITENRPVINAPDTTIEQNIKQTTVYILKLKVEDVDVDSVLELSCSVSSVKLDGSGMGNSFSYESGVMTDSASKEKFAEYSALINNPFRIRVTPTGELLEVSRVDRIINEYLNLKKLSDSVSSQEKEMLRRDMAEGALRPLMTILFRQMPDKAAAVDSTWEIAQAQSPFMSFNIQNTYTYELTSLEEYNDQTLAVISAGIRTAISGNTKFTDRGIAYTFEKPQTKAKGKIYFNTDLGCVQKSVTESQFSINYKMEMQTPQGKQKGDKKEYTINKNIVELL